MFARNLLGGGCVAALALVSACSEPDSSQVSADGAEAVAPWEFGGSVGTLVGPFPIPPDAAETTPQGSWFSAVLPSGDPIEAFEAVVADAETHGFEAFAESTGACRLLWGREEVPFDVESGTDDGLGFGGDVAVGDPLPAGAEVEGATCRAVVTRDDERISVTVDARGPSTAAYPDRTAVFLSSAVEDVPASEFDSVTADVDVEQRYDGPLTDQEAAVVGGDEGLPGLEILDVSIPGLRCRAGAMHSELSLRPAVTDAFEKALPKGFAVDPTIVTTTIGEWSAATAVAIVPAGGPVVYGMAVEREAGSSQLFCSQQF